MCVAHNEVAKTANAALSQNIGKLVRGELVLGVIETSHTDYGLLEKVTAVGKDEVPTGVIVMPEKKEIYQMQGAFSEMTVAQFADVVAKVSPSPKERGEPARLEVVSLDIAGDTAVARVRDDYMGLTFLDTLSFVNVDDRWQIYNKLYHVEGKAQ